MHGRSPLQHRCTNKEVYFFMNNLTTRKIVLGMLMALVLAFSVQGIADALTLTPVSDKVQSKLEGSKFEMSFSVGLNSNATASDTQRRRVSEC